MNNTDMLFVQKKLNDLVGCTLINLSRTSDLLCLSFAPRALTTEVQEEQSLHLQCYYRLVQDGRVSLARSDYFQPSEAMWNLWRKQGLEEDVIPDDYRCDELGANRLDDRIVELNDVLPAGGVLRPLTLREEEGRRIYERSLRFVLLLAVAAVVMYQLVLWLEKWFKKRLGVTE